MKKIIIKELQEVSNKYAGERKSQILYELEEFDSSEEEQIEDYPVTLFITKEGYLNKIRTANLRMSGEQKVKEGDAVVRIFECSNRDEILAFTNQCQVYKSKVDFFPDSKASQLGTYIPSKLEMAADERVIFTAIVREYKG